MDENMAASRRAQATFMRAVSDVNKKIQENPSVCFYFRTYLSLAVVNTVHE